MRPLPHKFVCVRLCGEGKILNNREKSRGKSVIHLGIELPKGISPFVTCSRYNLVDASSIFFSEHLRDFFINLKSGQEDISF